MGKTAVEQLEETLKKFWKEYGPCSRINARHTEVVVEPRIFLKDKLNPEIGRLIVMTYLSKVTSKDILEGRVSITPELITIKDETGETIVEITSKAIIESVAKNSSILQTPTQ